MDEDCPWKTYAHLQRIGDSDHLSNLVCAADEALASILDRIQGGEAISPDQADNLLTNRVKTQRARRKLLARHAYLLCPGDLDSFVWNGSEIHIGSLPELAAHEARSELVRCRDRCSDREMRVLTWVGLGHAYRDVAATEQVPEATIKTWVRRARRKLAA
jgi:DNA-binding NarL/FixJ family response regulator